jgi:hypothetical protein
MYAVITVWNYETAKVETFDTLLKAKRHYNRKKNKNDDFHDKLILCELIETD